MNKSFCIFIKIKKIFHKNRIESILTSIVYEHQTEKTDDFKSKWVQCNQTVNWNSFKDEEQMVNHIQSCNVFF